MRRGRRTVRLLVAVVAAAFLGAASPATAAGQVTWENLVVTAGVSAEGYEGNFLDVSAPFVDSTDRAAAAVGQLGGSGRLLLLDGRRRGLSMDFDLGLKQFEADGFELRDYAPRELVGSVDLRYWREVRGLGLVELSGHFKGRGVDDRPPMPLFIEPGYRTAGGRARLHLDPVAGVRIDATLGAELADYTPPGIAPHLDLLDRRTLSVEAGAEVGDAYALRFYGGYSASTYPEQGTFDPSDPSRRDRAYRAGARWSVDRPVYLSLGVEGTLNRSNSRRPEYNLVNATALLAAPLPSDFSVQLYGTVTGKNYLHESEFARLVPGEEADNASVVYLSLTRPLSRVIDASLRFGWTRAETEIGNSYFERYGASFFVHYRVGG